jgi:putative oxidoreductase
MMGLIRNINDRFAKVPTNLVFSGISLVARLWIAKVFLKSGYEKAKDLEGAADLFQYDWFSDENWWMTLFGFEEIPRLLAVLLAWMATAGELLLPVLLIIGLLTRFAGAGLMVMVLVISMLVYPVWTADGYGYLWTEFVWWVSSLLIIIVLGGQILSVDHWRKTRK